LEVFGNWRMDFLSFITIKKLMPAPSVETEPVKWDGLPEAKHRFLIFHCLVRVQGRKSSFCRYKLTCCQGPVGLLVGGIGGTLRSSTPILFALVSGIQWFALGSTFYGMWLLPSSLYVTKPSRPFPSFRPITADLVHLIQQRGGP
jgi:hypothetical protein